MKLYEIVEQHRQLLDLIKEGEVPEEAIADTLECIEGVKLQFSGVELAVHAVVGSNVGMDLAQHT